VLDAALAIVRSDGVDGLTMRGLAAKLGVAVTAIYWHVGDRQAVLDGLVDRIIAGFGKIRVRGRTPTARLMSIGRSLRANLLDQPDLVGLVHEQGRIPVLFLPAQRLVARELVAAGLRGSRAALAVHAFLRHIVGSVVLERTEDRSPRQRETVADLWAREPFPPDAALSRQLARPVDREALFEFSLAALVEALTRPTTVSAPSP
jgi:TetR/AcrR family tetracycline transcriptional repressor